MCQIPPEKGGGLTALTFDPAPFSLVLGLPTVALYTGEAVQRFCFTLKTERDDWRLQKVFLRLSRRPVLASRIFSFYQFFLFFFCCSFFLQHSYLNLHTTYILPVLAPRLHIVTMAGNTNQTPQLTLQTENLLPGNTNSSGTTTTPAVTLSPAAAAAHHGGKDSKTDQWSSPGHQSSGLLAPANVNVTATPVKDFEKPPSSQEPAQPGPAEVGVPELADSMRSLQLRPF